MPITNTYRRYASDGIIGLVANDSVPIRYVKDRQGKAGKFCITGTGSAVSIWNLRGSLPVCTHTLFPYCLRLIFYLEILGLDPSQL